MYDLTIRYVSNTEKHTKAFFPQNFKWNKIIIYSKQMLQKNTECLLMWGMLNKTKQKKLLSYRFCGRTVNEICCAFVRRRFISTYLCTAKPEGL